MDVDEVIKNVTSWYKTGNGLERAGKGVSTFLKSGTEDEIQELRNRLSVYKRDNGSYVAGYLDSLLDVLSSPE